MANLDIDKLKRTLAGIVQNVLLAQAQSVTESMNELKAEFITRIFTNGQAADGTQIGSYSTKPMYASIPALTKQYGSQIGLSGLKPRGKKKGTRDASRSSKNKTVIKRFRGDSEDFTAKVVTKRTSMYLPGGYLELREVVGRKTDKVDLSMGFSLRGDINVRDNLGTPSLTFLNDKEVLKAQGNEKRFGKTIFAVTEDEADIVINRWREDVENAFLDSFK